MANTYANTPVLSKIKVGTQTYYLKDLDARGILDSYKGAVNYDVDTTFNDKADNLATEKAIAAYLEGKIAGLTGAMHFVGVVTDLSEITSPKDGDVAIVGTTEYVYANGEWKELGDEGTLVRKTFTIAGIDMMDNITASELQTALSLKALAYKDSVSGSIQVITAVGNHTYTPEGDVAVTLSQTPTAIESTGKLTPAGSVTGSVIAEGTVSAPTISVVPATAKVQHITSVGSLPSYTKAVYVAPSIGEASTSAFAVNGMVAEVSAEDNETLMITNAAKAQAVTSCGEFNAGSYTEAEFNAGSLPVLGAEQTVVTGITSATASAPVFSGSEATIAATFAGNEAAISVSGSYDKAAVQSASFTGTEATIEHNLTQESKTITAS